MKITFYVKSSQQLFTGTAILQRITYELLDFFSITRFLTVLELTIAIQNFILSNVPKINIGTQLRLKIAVANINTIFEKDRR